MITYLFLIDFMLPHCINCWNLFLMGRLVLNFFVLVALTFVFMNVIQYTVAYQCVRIFIIVQYKNKTLAHVLNACLYFVMVTLLYLLYITTTLYLITTYIVSSTKNGLKNNRKVNTNDDNRYTATNGLTILNVGADNICLLMIINFVSNIYWQ